MTQPLQVGSSRAQGTPLAAGPCFYANMLASNKTTANKLAPYATDGRLLLTADFKVT